MSKSIRDGDSRATVASRPRARRRTPAAEQMLQPGERIAERYRIVRFVAAGGMGEVYAAFDEALHQEIALKTLVPDLTDAPHVERFRGEIALARKVTHPNVCRIFDLGQHTFPDGDARAHAPLIFLTMELIEGPTLMQRIREGRIGLDEARRIVQQMAQGLAAAHESGVIHRDFKPSNVLLRAAFDESRGLRAVITDFGLALPEDAAEVQGESAMGTPEYMAPEQLRGMTLTPACDVYALGIVIFEMLTGELPFPPEDPYARLELAPVPLRRKRKDAPAAWERAVLRCLEATPRDRYASPLDVAAALDGAAPPRGRARIYVAGALALAAAGAGAALLARRPAATPPAHAAAVDGVAARAAVPKRRRTVAVLGFKNSSARPETAWLSTALGEMLANEIAAGADVRVIPPDTVARVKLEMGVGDGDAVTPTVLQRLRDRIGADLVADGAYLVLGTKDAARVRLDLRLQETNAGETVAQASEQARVTELFELVSRAGDQLRLGLGAEKLPAHEASGVRASLPANPEAARLYAEGLAELRRLDPLAAREHLEQAAAIEPDHPFIHSTLSSAWSALGYDANAEREAKRAYDLSSRLSRADRLSIEARYRETEPNWDEAIRLYRALFSFFPDDLEYGLRLAHAELSSGHGKDALATLATLRQLPPPAGTDPSIDLAEAQAAETLSDFKREETAAQAAIKKGSALGARLVVERAHISEGSARWGQGDARGALAAFAESKRIAVAANDRDAMARALQMLANTHAQQQDPAANDEFTQALALYRQVGDRSGEAGALSGMATLVSDAEPAQACKLYEEALKIDRLIGDKRRIAVELNNLAVSDEQLGKLVDAGKRFSEAAAVFRQAGYDSAAGSALSNLAANLLNRGDIDGARDTAQEALQILKPTESQPDVAWAEAVLAAVLREADDLDGAGRRIDQALARARKLEQPQDVAAYTTFQARLALDAGHARDAERLSRTAADVAHGAKSPRDEAYAWATLAETLEQLGRHDEAKTALGRAQAAQPATGVDPDHALYLVLAAARVQAVDDRAAALKILDVAMTKAAAGGYVLHQLLLRTQLAELGRGDAQSVASDARARGLSRLARVAGTLPHRR